MARLNPTAQVEADRPRSEAEILAFLTPVLPTIVTAPFDPEQTRPFFETQVIAGFTHLDQGEESLRSEFLSANPWFPGDYANEVVQLEWQGWKRGVMLGYELWGKK